jgi:hypothetical protein
MNGHQILWLVDKSSITDFTKVVNGVDYRILKYFGSWPAMNPDQALGNDLPYEWLLPETIGVEPVIDQRLWVLNVFNYPSNTPNTLHSVHNSYITSYSVTKKTKEEIIVSIREAQANANASLIKSSDQVEMDALWRTAMQKLQSGITIETNSPEQAALNRANELTVKVMQNAENAANLIDLVDADQEPDLDSGWETDNFTQQSYPLDNV